jgi:hypothetical protein
LKFFSLIFFLIALSSFQTKGQVVNLKGTWKFHVGDKSSWSSPDFDDSDWEYIHAPSPWEEEGFNGYDGFAWYRRKFNGRTLDKNETHYLNLGFIDDCDEVFVNGFLVGFSGSMPPKFKTAYNSERKYSLPSNVINYNGDNTIAIRIFDVTISGGICDGDLGIFTGPANRLLVDLQGLWYFSTTWEGDNVSSIKEWKKIMVPSPWEHQGFKYDGFAWYKRTFTLPANFTNDPLVLLMGKIDDFDKVYLNGKLIGSTADYKSFGSSESYEKLRGYAIPPNALKKTGENTLEVLVEDMGNVGGIYEGPVGITTKTNYEKYFK